MFTKEDLEKYRAFKKVIEAGDFDIKGNTIITIAVLKQWFDSLEIKITEDVKAGQVKPLKPIKKKETIRNESEI